MINNQLQVIQRMDFLLNSRLDRTESPHKLDNISPQKYGKSAYASLSYTPSKLAGNVLYKQVSSMRKLEESSSKAREWQAINNFLTDKLRHLQEEKEGIQQSLNQQIAMYKRMINEMETTHEKRIRALQAYFSEEMQKIILIKEEEAKYVQSEKELLENRIYELEEVIAGLKEELQTQMNTHDNAGKIIDQLQHTLAQEKQNGQTLENKLKEEIAGRKSEAAEQAKQRALLQQSYSNRLKEKETEYLTKIKQITIQNDKDMESIKKAHDNQLKKMESLHQSEARSKEEQLRGLRNTFQAESRRLNEALSSKDQMVKHLNDAINNEKDKMAEMAKKYTHQIGVLTQQRQKLLQQVESNAREAALSKQQLKKFQSNSTQTSANLQSAIDKLKKEVDCLKEERQQLFYHNQDMRRQIAILRKSVERTSLLLEQNSIMSKQLKSMKDLLMQSSLEMQRCKGEFLRLDKEKDVMMVKLRELDAENETLYRIKLEMEEEAKIWRETYYMNRK